MNDPFDIPYILSLHRDDEVDKIFCETFPNHIYCIVRRLPCVKYVYELQCITHEVILRLDLDFEIETSKKEHIKAVFMTYADWEKKEWPT